VAIDDITLDPSITPQRFNRNIINFGGGIYFNTDRFYLGVSAPRLSEADLDFDNSLGISIEKRIYYAMTGGRIDINRDWTFSPQILFRYVEDAPWDMDVNASFTYDARLTAGINYRYGGDNSSPGESIDLMVGIQLNEGLLLGVSYDFTLTKLRKETAGSIEAIVSYTLGQGSNRKVETNPRYF
jgi:type IX secretion system PorP/SprF family membrane protein